MSPTRTRPIPDALGTIGWGLLTGGVLLAVVALFRLGAMGSDGPTTAAGLPSWWAAVLLGAIAALVTPRWSKEAAKGPPDGRWSHAVLLGVVALLSLYASYSGFPTDAFWATAPSGEEYSAVPIRVSIWAAPTVMMLGELLAAASPHRPQVRAPRRFLPLLAVGLALAVAAEIALRTAALHQPVDYVAAAPVPEVGPAVPTEVNQVGWSWEAPADARLEAVRPGLFGPLLLFEDGVVALDGTTGQELWHYREPYRDVVEVSVTDDGATAVVASLPKGQPSGDQTVTEIATRSGKIARESVLDSWIADAALEDAGFEFFGRTPHTRLFFGSVDGKSARWSARSADTGEEVWSFTVPEEEGRACVQDGPWTSGRNFLVVENRVLFLYACVDKNTGTPSWHTDPWVPNDDPDNPPILNIVAKNADTGKTAWERTWEGPVETFSSIASPNHPPDREADPVIALDSSGDDPPLLLDPTDGSPINDSPEELVNLKDSDQSNFKRLLYSDTDTSIVQVSGDSERLNPATFRMVSHIDGSTDTLRIPGDMLSDEELLTSTALGDSIAFMSRSGGPDSYSLSFATLPFGSDVNEIDWIDLTEIQSDAGPDGMRDAWRDRAQVVPVPGAVVAYVKDTEPMVVHGLVG
ncbi:PQQ-binding-like beta-propeller repeat protein [Nocardiopsis sp. RSe5-2]|uniref:PQQ-binding-like beta-propeller repeat protein n=1 Tax=Nocardiopsis endophytica TaxID=3018445 RepID=A0ABT4TZ09_9ACTN|nr:PQQ-binding-like beta-propeller repeat protein [Nocardiopsis endophytica]MDA2809465.1 PQQ-binding-like beta-propeller repeat protein [Nocardiopsis endophytica]